MVIRYLKEKALEDIRSIQPNLNMENVGKIQEDKIDYAITVPSCWHDTVRKMVRFAAFEAGIESDRLVLIQESDAATIWCRNDPDLMSPELQKTGTKYIVVNMGDSKMEITAHEVTKSDTLKQLPKSVFTVPGGRVIDDEFLYLFKDIFGEETMEEFKTDYPYEYTEFVDSFTRIKHRITGELSKCLYVKLPAILCDINVTKTKDTGKDFRSVVKSKDRYLGLLADKLRIDPEYVRSTIFVDCIENLVYTIQEHPNLNETDYILCTGGFSNCKYVLDVLADYFPAKKIICSKDGHNSVARGAVIFRHRPGVFGKEAKFTYGRSVHVRFDKKLHSGLQKSVIGDELCCTEAFRKYVTKGQVISYDFEITECGLLPITGDRLHATCSLYSSSMKSPLFVSDDGCTLVGGTLVGGTLVGDTFSHKFPHEKELSNRKYNLTVRFLFDEIRVTFVHLKSEKTVTKTMHISQ